MSGSLGFKAEGVLSVSFLLVGTLVSGVDSFSDGTVFIILIIRKGSLIPLSDHVWILISPSLLIRLLIAGVQQCKERSCVGIVSHSFQC